MTTELKKPELITRQVNTLDEAFHTGVNEITRNVENCISTEELRSIRNIITAGDGDSYFASLAAELAFNRLTNVHYNPTAAMKFVAYGADQVRPFSNSKSILLGISASGGSTRVIQAINQAKSLSPNVLTMGMVGKTQSKMAEVSQYVLSTELPDLGRSPGIRTYVGSLLGLYLLAIRMGVVQNTITQEQAGQFRAELLHIGDVVQGIVKMSQEKALAASRICKDAPVISFVGSGPSFGSAMYSGAKVVEAAGKFMAAQDLEEWGHIERFSYPLDFPVFMIAPPDNSYWRAVQLANAVTLLGHPLIAVVDEKENEISSFAKVVFRIPNVTSDIFSPLLYFIPATLLAYQMATDLGRCLLQTDNEIVNSVRDALNKQTKV